MRVHVVVRDQSVSIYSNSDHGEERHCFIPVEDEGEHLAETGSEAPVLFDVPVGGERQVDGAEEEVRHTEREDEHRGHMAAQLRVHQQRHRRYQVTDDSDDTKDAGARCSQHRGLRRVMRNVLVHVCNVFINIE